MPSLSPDQDGHSKLSRRAFIGTAGGAAGVMGFMGLERLLWSSPADAADDIPWEDGVETWTSSVCRACPAGCGIRGRLVDDRLVRIEGNPLHPVSRGGLCPKGIASLQAPHDPDRPLHCGSRDAELRQGGPLARLEPEAALRLLAARIRQAQGDRDAAGIAILDGTGPSGASLLLRQLARGIGLAGCHTCDPDLGLALGCEQTQGVAVPPAFDIQNADLVMAFGAGFLEDDSSPVRRAFDVAEMRQTAAGRRPRLLVVEPRFSTSAARADTWVPIRPGTYGALALGIAYVVLREGRQASAFIKEWTAGYDDAAPENGSPAAAYRDLVLEHGRPDRVARVTGISVDMLLQIGKQFASAHRAIAIPCREVTWHGDGVRNAALIHSLNALVGSLEVPGGARTPLAPPLAGDFQGSWSGHAENAERLILDVVEGRTPPPRVLVLANAEPQEWPGCSRAWGELRERVPFIATFVNRPGPSVATADLVLPAATFLEDWDIWCGPTPTGPPVVGASRPLLKAPGDARSMADWTLALAEMLGKDVSAKLPWSSSKEHVREHLRALHAAGRGTPFTEDLTSAHLLKFEERGWWEPTSDGFDEFEKRTLASGGWWDPFYSDQQYGRALRTPDGRFHFASDLGGQLLQAPVETSADEARLSLNPFPLIVFTGGGGGAELPWLQQIADGYGRSTWDSWIELHPGTARSLGVEDGDEVIVGNRRGSFRATVRVFAGTAPDLVNVPIGFSPHSTGRYSRDRGDRLFELLGRNRDPLSGLASLSGTRVWIQPA